MNHFNLLTMLLSTFRRLVIPSAINNVIVIIRGILKGVGSSFLDVQPLIYDYYISGNLLLLALSYVNVTNTALRNNINALLLQVQREVTSTSNDVIHDVSYQNSVKIINHINNIINVYLQIINLKLSDKLELLFDHVNVNRSLYVFSDADVLLRKTLPNLPNTITDPVLATKGIVIENMKLLNNITDNKDKIRLLTPVSKFDITSNIDERGVIHIVTAT